VKLRSTEIPSVAGLAHGSLAQHKPWRCPLCRFINNFVQMIGFPAGQKYAAGRGWIGWGGAPSLREKSNPSRPPALLALQSVR
jgi:hypothetical protein